jgi:putative PIN family toxin of toxin-antitoxin system
MIVVLDTNVLVSGVLSPFGPAGAMMRFVASGMISLALDARILTEYREVLTRPVFGFSDDVIAALLDQIEKEGQLVVAQPLRFRLPDACDEPFLEVALAAKASVLVTGNKRHFPKRDVGVRILSPAEFLMEYGLEQKP